MNISWGGRQNSIRNSKIESEEFLGNQRERCLNCGDVQLMIFEENSAGSFCLANALEYKYDKILTEEKIRKRTRKKKKKISEKQIGWVGKPKGMKQILYERGLHIQT